MVSRPHRLSNNVVLSTLDQAVLATLAYGQVFRQTPTFTETAARLISPQIFSTRSLRPVYEFWTQRLGLIPPDSDWVAWSSSLHQMQRIQSLVWWLPWVQAVWVTGSVAAGNLQGDDDLDLCVVTSPHRLWITRLLLVCLSYGLGKYRPRLAQSGRATRGKWCWNLWLEESAFSEIGPECLYVARELVQAKLIFVRQGTSPTLLLDSAPWVKDWSYAGWRSASHQARRVSPASTGGRRQVWSFVADFLNEKAWQLQQKYMQPHRTRERVEKNQAWFHPHAWAEEVQRRYETILADWKRYE